MTDQPTRLFARADGTTDVDGTRMTTFVASTPGVKRDGLELRPLGWRTENYRSNPVFLWAHNYRSLPIGRTELIDANESDLRIGVEFDTEDPFAATVERKYRDGFLNAVSVGWDWVREDGSPIDFATWLTTSDEELAREFFYDLLEVSGVPVPADPDALVERQRAGVAHLRELGFAPVPSIDEQTQDEDPEPTPTPERKVTSLAMRRRRLALLSRP